MKPVNCKVELCIWNEMDVCMKDSITISSVHGGEAGCDDFEEGE